MSTFPKSNAPSEYPTDFGKFTPAQRREFLQFVDDGMKSYGDPVPEHLQAAKTNRYSSQSEVSDFTSTWQQRTDKVTVQAGLRELAEGRLRTWQATMGGTLAGDLQRLGRVWGI